MTATHASAEPRTTPPVADDGGRLEWRFRLIAACLALVALAFVQKPGQIVADTKLDLVVDPGGLLARSLHLWDAEGAFGQLQNQGYGYLFPMGPFFWLGELAQIPPWAVQRAWYAVVLVVAFLGAVKLAELLGIGRPGTRIIAGFAFALSPRLMTTLGPISIEAWPSAVAPWVLIPLVYGSRRGSPVRAAALAGLAVALVGGVNAAAAAAVLPLPVLWLLLQRPGPRRRRLMLWWPAFTLLGTLWWLLPLFLLGRYSPPFLDFIESARVTTFPTTLFDSVRGTSHWVPYLEGEWAAGRMLLTEPYLILDVTVVAALGLVGLARADMPYRGFLVSGLFVGLLLVTAGHLGALQGWWAEDVRGWLDAALAPLRNVHKYDVILRLPMVLGLAHLLAALAPKVRQQVREPSRAVHVGVTAVAVIAVLGSATPMLTGSFTREGAFSGIPGYWHEAVDWLGEEDSETYALLVPGSSFGSYGWGNPGDEPVQPLARSPWAVRNAIPLAPPGNIRMLDAVETRLNQGQGSPGLAPYLARAGVEYLVVRNDLVRGDDVPEPVLVHQALRDSPGIAPVAQFGPDVGGDARLDDGSGRRVVVNRGWQAVYPAVEIYRVAGAHRAVAGATAPVVAGGPEDLLSLHDLGVLGGEPTTLAVDTEDARGERLILTDGLRLRSTAFGRVHDNKSPTLTREEAAIASEERPARDYDLDEGDRWATFARLEGIEAVRASSSLSDPTGRPTQPQHSPFAAVDGDPRTSWVSGFGDGEDGPWLELRFDEQVSPRRIGIRLGDGAGRERRSVVVETDQGEVTSEKLGVETWGRVTVPAGPTSTLRIRLAEQSRWYGARLAVAELSVPGLEVARPLVLPRLPAVWGSPDTIVLSAAEGHVRGCIEVGAETRCAPGRAAQGEDGAVLDRVVRLSKAADYTPRLVVAPRPGPQLDALLQQGQAVGVSASSSTSLDPAGSALAAIDAQSGTTWTADPQDLDPTLQLQWLGQKRIDGIRIALGRSAAAVPAQSVQLIAPEGRRTVRLDENGVGSFKPLRTDQLVIRFLTWGRGSNLDYDETSSDLSVGVSNLSLSGMDLLPMRLGFLSRDWGCGSGPAVTVNGQRRRSALVASPRELFAGDEVEARLCEQSRIQLGRGANRIVVDGAPGVRPEALVLEGDDVSGARGARPLGFRAEGPARAVLEGPLRIPSTIALRQNRNDGWGAAYEGQELEPVTVDGWQQGWVVPEAGTGPVVVEYEPDQAYRAGLVVGAGTLLLLTLLVFVMRAGTSLPPLRQRSTRRVVGALAGAAAMGLVAGTWAAAAVVVGAALIRWTPLRRGLPVLPWLLALPLLAASVAYVANPWTDPDGWAGAGPWPQVLVASTLVLLLLSLLGETGPVGRSRMKGRSTTR